MEQFMDEFYFPEDRSEVKAILYDSLHKHMQTSKMVNDLKRNCNSCFEKLSAIKREKIVLFLKREQFHEAFKALNLYFVRLGAGNVRAFEEEVLSYRLQPGQDFSTHLDALTQALKRWANILYLEKMLHSVGTDPIKAAKAIDIPEQIALWNSGDETDNEVLTAYDSDVKYGAFVVSQTISPVLIPEVRRFNILQASVCESLRFKQVADTFSSMSESERSLRLLITRLQNQEISPLGQQALMLERATVPSWQANLNRYLSQIRSHGASSHTPNTKAKGGAQQQQANVATTLPQDNQQQQGGKKRKHSASANVTASDSTTPAPKSCIHHPNSTTHTTAECRGAKKAKTEQDTVKPSRGSGSSTYQGKPCSFCGSTPKYKGIAHTHSTERCKLDPTNPKRNPNSSSYDPTFGVTANVAQAAQPAALTVADTSLLKQISSSLAALNVNLRDATGGSNNSSS